MFSSDAKVRPKSVAFLNAETALHDYWGGPDYWMARRSMRFNSILMGVADKFRRDALNSTDSFDGTEKPNDWRHERVYILIININSKQKQSKKFIVIFSFSF